MIPLPNRVEANLPAMRWRIQTYAETGQDHEETGQDHEETDHYHEEADHYLHPGRRELGPAAKKPSLAHLA